MRIVSLLPSTTEILFAIGAGDDVVGVTFECDHPTEARSRRIVSTSGLAPGLTPAQIDKHVRAALAAGEDLYRLDAGALADLEPDLVLTQDLCAVCAVDVGTVETAMAHLGGGSARLLTVDPSRLDDVIASITTIGAATGRQAAAAVLVEELCGRLATVADAVRDRRRPRVAVLEWIDPPYTAGHWVPDLVTSAGGDPVLGTAGGRSVRVSMAEIADSHPELIVVAPCGYGLPAAIEQTRALIDTSLFPSGVPVWAMDADGCVVRPGPRLVDGVEALAAMLHPGLLPARADIAACVGTA